MVVWAKSVFLLIAHRKMTHISYTWTERKIKCPLLLENISQSWDTPFLVYNKFSHVDVIPVLASSEEASIECPLDSTNQLSWLTWRDWESFLIDCVDSEVRLHLIQISCCRCWECRCRHLSVRAGFTVSDVFSIWRSVLAGSCSRGNPWQRPKKKTLPLRVQAAFADLLWRRFKGLDKRIKKKFLIRLVGGHTH